MWLHRFLDAFNCRDYDGMMAQYDDNCVLEDLAYDTPVEGSEVAAPSQQAAPFPAFLISLTVPGSPATDHPL